MREPNETGERLHRNGCAPPLLFRRSRPIRRLVGLHGPPSAAANATVWEAGWGQGRRLAERAHPPRLAPAPPLSPVPLPLRPPPPPRPAFASLRAGRQQMVVVASVVGGSLSPPLPPPRSVTDEKSTAARLDSAAIADGCRRELSRRRWRAPCRQTPPSAVGGPPTSVGPLNAPPPHDPTAIAGAVAAVSAGLCRRVKRARMGRLADRGAPRVVSAAVGKSSWASQEQGSQL